MESKEDFIKAELNTTRLTPIQWQGIMIAMEKYAEQQVKLFAIPDVSNNEVAVCSFENKCILYQESNCNQKTCGDFHKQTDC